MRKHLAALLLAVTLTGCSDIVGESACSREGTDCFVEPGLVPEILEVRFQEVSTSGPRSLPIAWRVPSPCSEPCVRELQLQPAGDDGVWSLSRLESVPSLEHIDAAGTRSTQTFPSELNTRALDRVSLASRGDGTAFVHAQWTTLTGANGPDLVHQHAVQGPTAGVLTVPPTRGLITPRNLLLNPAGLLLYEGGTFSEAGLSRSVVRQLDAAGTTLWQTTKLPAFARVLGSSALQTPGRIALGASDDDARSPKFGVLWLDESGVPVRFAYVSDSDWRSASLVSMRGGAYALGADSDVLSTGLSGAGDGNIDVVVFGENGALSGYRLKHDCFYKLTLNGFASDERGNLYVSSVTGSEYEPRGLLCRLPAGSGGAPSCFQAEVGTLIGKLVAASNGVLYAALGRMPAASGVVNGPKLSSDTEIARIELPE